MSHIYIHMHPFVHSLNARILTHLPNYSQVVPPASAPLAKIRPCQGGDAVLEHLDEAEESVRPRPPSWKLPANRLEQSRQWVKTAALAYR